jgi:NAD(P)-dependent dehydrogenase (short-subunit alcohol dehydrogenase family)
LIRSGVVREELYTRRAPMRRLARPEEIARAAVFLASEEQAASRHGNDARRRRRLDRVRWSTDDD